jgi:hypothetical protein
MPWGARSVQASIDVFDAEMRIETSDGGRRRIALVQAAAQGAARAQTVARVFAELHASLDELGVDVRLSPIPQEIPDQTPMDADDRPAMFDAAQAQTWHSVISATNGVFDRWREHFFGRVGLALWWGAFDYSVMLFSGKHVTPPLNRGYLLRYDLDAELMNAGFYPGDEANPAFYYGYIYPEPPGSSGLAIQPAGASWSGALGEWVLPYETVRTAADPAAMLTTFLDSVYGVCCSRAGWDGEQLSYVPPPLRRAPEAKRG